MSLDTSAFRCWWRPIGAIGVALGLAAGARAQPIGSPVTPTTDNPNRYAVSGVAAARRVYQMAAARRVDFCLIGDSNARMNSITSGHEDAMGRALAARFGMYATRVLAFSEGGSKANGSASWQNTPFQAWGANPFVDQRSFTAMPFPRYYAFLPDATWLTYWFNSGVMLYPDTPVNIEAALRFHMTYYSTGPDSPAYFNLCARESWPGNIYHNYAELPQISAAAPAPGFADISLDIPAGPRTETGIMMCLSNVPAERGAYGPLALTYCRIENVTRSSGIAYSNYWEEGGRSARYALFTLQTFGVHDATLEWYRQAVSLQSGPPVLVVQIMHGGNDTNDFNPSLGPIGGLDSSAGPGHEDNIRGIINLLRAWWVEAGYDPANLFFQLGPYHPRPEVAQQLQYEQAWRNIAAADPQVYAVAGTRMSTPTELLNRGFLLNGYDPYHLSATGFPAWAAATVRAIDLAICPSDFNQNGANTVADIFAFLGPWFAHDPRADFDYSGTVEVADIFAFLSSWFQGC